MRFSIVIPTHQRREIVTRTVAALDRQTFSDFEVIAVVDGSTDGSAESLRGLETSFPLTVIEGENEGAGVARNVGAAAAAGEFLVFLDDDMEADPEMLAEHDRSMREGGDMVLGHLPLHPQSPDTLLSQGVGRWAERRRERLEGLGSDVPVTELNTGQMSVARATFEELGGFDVSFTREGLYGGEDLDFGYRVGRAGLRVVFNPAAISRQFYAVDPAAYTRRTREAGRAARELKLKHPELTQDLRAGREFTTWRSRVIFGSLARLPSILSWPLRAIAAHRVRTGRMDFHTYRLFFALQTMEFQRGSHRGRRRAKTGRAAVLAYHAIADLGGDPVLGEYGLPPDRLAAQLDALIARDCRFVDLAAVEAALRGDLALPKRSILVTFDDGYADLLSAACPILAAREIPAVVFAITDRIGGTNEWDHRHGAGLRPLLDEDGLREVAARGVSVGSHGSTHRRLTELPRDELEAELRGSAARLHDVGLPLPTAFSYPYGVWNRDLALSVHDAGYALAFTVRPGVVSDKADPYALPRIEVFARDTALILRLKITTATWPAWLRRPLLRLLRAKP